ASSSTWGPPSVLALALRAGRLSLTFWRAARVPALPASGGSSWSSSATDALRAAASGHAGGGGAVVGARRGGGAGAALPHPRGGAPAPCQYRPPAALSYRCNHRSRGGAEATATERRRPSR